MVEPGLAWLGKCIFAEKTYTRVPCQFVSQVDVYKVREIGMYVDVCRYRYLLCIGIRVCHVKMILLLDSDSESELKGSGMCSVFCTTDRLD